MSVNNRNEPYINTKLEPTEADSTGLKLSELKKPLAIAMWDFSWLLRHHRLGEFEDWDKVLDGLVARGYNAIRIDCFPFLVAADNEGKIEEEFFCPKPDWSPALWGNQYSVHVSPRKALLEFLPKCRERGIRVGLSTWFSGHGTGRNDIFEGVEGLVRSWDETLQFLEDHGLLEDILYVDLLNEYPLCHTFNWLKRAMLADERKVSISEIKLETVGNEHIWSPEKAKFDTVCHIGFINEVIERVSQKWVNIDVFASLTPYEDKICLYGNRSMEASGWKRLKLKGTNMIQKQRQILSILASVVELQAIAALRLPTGKLTVLGLILFFRKMRLFMGWVNMRKAFSTTGGIIKTFTNRIESCLCL